VWVAVDADQHIVAASAVEAADRRTSNRERQATPRSSASLPALHGWRLLRAVRGERVEVPLVAALGVANKVGVRLDLDPVPKHIPCTGGRASPC